MDAKTLNKLRFHLDRIVRGTSSDPEEDWRKLDVLVPSALRSAPTTGSVALRRMLEEFAPRLGERRLVDHVYALDQELQRVARAGGHKPPPPSGPRTPTQEVADLLRGRWVLLIGGDTRPDHADRLREAFELEELVWPGTSESNPSVAVFEPLVARPEIVLVLMLIKLNRHGITEELPAVCERYGKPIVRLVGGYHPDQVAVQILNQAARRLRGGAA